MAEFIDLSGKKFGRLVAKFRVGSGPRAAWNCLCACGNETTVEASNLRSENTTSCGCARRSDAPDHDLSGHRFGGLVPVSPVRKTDGSNRSIWFWLCKCDCGVTKEVRASTLRSGASRSCGCRIVDATRERNLKHGRSGTRAHRIWKGMLTRCQNPNANSFERYGGRGIRVCERWQSFEHFYADMGDPPDGHSIDRLDGSGNYEKSNCVWSRQQDSSPAYQAFSHDRDRRRESASSRLV